jgi:hypothetical protein
VLGTRNGQYCGSNNFDNTSFPISFTVPAGTTRLEQLVICGASQCDPGAAMHSHLLEVTVDDPQPPSISLSGALVSGQWVSGAVGHSPAVEVTANDNTGVQRIETALGPHGSNQAYGCDWSQSQPCASQATMVSLPGVGDLSDGRHTIWVSAIDAASNSAAVPRDVYVDNTPPDPVLPEVAGGTAWRRSNGLMSPGRIRRAMRLQSHARIGSSASPTGPARRKGNEPKLTSTTFRTCLRLRQASTDSMSGWRTPRATSAKLTRPFPCRSDSTRSPLSWRSCLRIRQTLFVSRLMLLTGTPAWRTARSRCAQRVPILGTAFRPSGKALSS